MPYEHKVLAFVEGKHVPIPVNIDTVNALFGLEISTEAEMDTWLRKEQVAVPVPVPAPAKKAFPFLNDDDSHAADASRDIVSRNTDNNISLPEVELRPKNSEETALSRVGRRLFELLFKPYTIKQWASFIYNLFLLSFFWSFFFSKKKSDLTRLYLTRGREVGVPNSTCVCSNWLRATSTTMLTCARSNLI